MAEFQLGLVEVGLEPVQGVLPELPGAQGVGQWSGDDGAGLQDGLVVGQDDGVGDVFWRRSSTCLRSCARGSS